MKTSKGPLVWALMLVGMLAIFVVTHCLSEARLRENALTSREQGDQIAVLRAENVRLSNLLAQTPSREVRPNEPSAELLQLRGKVGQLRDEVEMLRQENRQWRGPSINEEYAMSGYDTNGLPDSDMGATKNEVLSELRKGPATIMSEMDRYIRAEAVVAKASGGSATLVMRFQFDDGGRLVARTDSEE